MSTETRSYADFIRNRRSTPLGRGIPQDLFIKGNCFYCGSRSGQDSPPRVVRISPKRSHRQTGYTNYIGFRCCRRGLPQ